MTELGRSFPLLIPLKTSFYIEKINENKRVDGNMSGESKEKKRMREIKQAANIKVVLAVISPKVLHPSTLANI